MDAPLGQAPSVQERARARTLLSLGLWVLGCEMIGIIGGLATASQIQTWYAGLEKPAFTPPGWLFGPVWTILYALMGVAAWRIGRGRSIWPLSHEHQWFGAQLLVNLSWSFVFFAAHQPGWALLVILTLDALVAATIALFWRRDRTAAYLLLPYMGWIAFATVLNASIWLLNRS